MGLARVVTCVSIAILGWSASALAQDAHLHTPGVSGMPQGVPFFCGTPTVTSVTTGPWSNPATWSTRKVPAVNDRVAIDGGQTVTYDAVSDTTIECIEVRGTLAFKTDANTRLKVVTIMVLDSGSLKVGTAAAPVAATATAEIVVADRPFNPDIDPAQIGHGIVALGKVT